MAAAVDGGKVNAETTYVDTGTVQEAGFNIKNSEEKVYGKQTMTQVLENSINTGVIYAEKLLGNRNFHDYIERFGFGKILGVDLSGESAGSIANLKNTNRNIEFFTASFGQGIRTTPLQIISAYNVIANGGVLMKPQIVEKKIYHDGSEETINPQEIRRVMTSASASEVSRMLTSVVKNGHGKRAGVPGYLVAGKTGTAEVAKVGSKGYEEDKTIGSFAGFAPSDNPKFSIIVRIDNPKNVQWAESSAAPAFGELMKFLLEYYNIEPTEEYTQEELDAFNATHDLGKYSQEEEEKEEEKDLNKEENKEVFPAPNSNNVRR
jgi:cell division protein FtsI/penicillin-binding protein 2